MATRTNKTVYISPIDIREYSICPQRLALQRQYQPELFPGPGEFFGAQHLYLNREPDTHNVLFATFRDVVKMTFAFVNSNSKRIKRSVSWNAVRTSIGHAMTFRAKLGLPIPSDATRLIELTQSFYKDYLIGGRRLMDIPIYPNFPVLVPLGRGRVYADILHALGMGEYGPILFDFRLTPTASTSYTLADLQQDTMLGARLWGLKELANEMPHELVIFYFGIASGIKVRTLSLYCKSEHNSFTAQHFINMSHIMDGIIKQVSYPSRRPDCQYCIHKEKCDAIMNQGGSNYDKVCK